MKKLSIKNLVEFRGKSDRSKRNFATAIKVTEVKGDSEGGGDYWVSCLSAISNSYKSNDLQAIFDKKGQLEEKFEETENKRTKTMYKRNIDILYSYEDFDLKKWTPTKKINFVKKQKDDFILTVEGLLVQATPHHVFTFHQNDIEQIGAIWFIAKLNGFTSDELGMFTDILYRYLNTHFSQNYNLNSRYCIAVDVFNNTEVNYSQLEKGEIPMILSSTLDEINKLM